MIILKIRFIPKPEMSLEDGANFLHDNFPQEDTLISVGAINALARDDDHLICLKLRQDSLTDFQRDYLHLSAFAAAYIDDFEVDTNPIDTETKPVHQHTYSVAAGPVSVRYCTACGTSWVLDCSYGWHWVPVTENKIIDQDKSKEEA